MCLPHGYAISKTIDRLRNQLSLIINRAADTKGCFGHVKKGWSDAGLVNGYFNARHMRERFDITEPFRILPEVPAKVPLYFIISKSYPQAKQHMTAFNTALKTLRENGSMTALDQKFDRWLTEEERAQPRY